MLLFLFTTLLLPFVHSYCTNGYKYGGNPLVEYSEKVTIKGFDADELTSPTVDVIPLVSTTISVSQVSSYLTSNGWVSAAIAENIQSRLNFASSMKSVFNDFASANSTFNFYSLPKSQQTVNNFYNLHLQRSSVLFSAQKGVEDRESVNIQLKKVVVSIRKRRSRLESKKFTFPVQCHDNVQQCGYTPVSTSKCTNVPYMIGTMTSYRIECKLVTEQKYSCKMVPKDWTDYVAQDLYKYELYSSYNQGEVDQIYALLNNAAVQHMALQ